MVEIINTSKTKTNLLKIFFKLFLWLVVTIIFFIGLLLSLLIIYEDEVKAAIIKELNKNLQSEVKIKPENIQLTIVSTFPDCTIEFKEVLMLDAIKNKNRDTLLYANQLNLHFNIQDLWSEKYNIKKISLKNGNVKLRTSKNGKNNYTFWKESKGGEDKNDSLRFDLQEIKLNDVRLLYADKQQDLKAEININQLLFSGNFSTSEYELNTSSKLYVEALGTFEQDYINNKNCDIYLNFEVKNNNYKINKAKLNINQMDFVVNGSFIYDNSLQQLNLKYDAPQLDIASVLSLLPEDYKKRVNDYKSNGKLYANGQFNYQGENKYLLSSEFGIKQSNILYKPTSTQATNVNLEGEFLLTESKTRLELKNINLQLKEDLIKGSMVIQNFSRPEISLTTEADIHFNNLQSFWPIDTVQSISGTLKLKAACEGLLEDMKTSSFSNKVKFEFDAAIADLEIQLKLDPKKYSLETCNLSAKQGEVEFHNMKLKRGESDLKLNGKLPGFFNYLFTKDQPLVIKGALYSNFIRLEDFLPETNASASTSNEPLIPKDMEFKLNAAILKFNYAKFEANAITGEIEIKNQKAIATNVKLQTMEGDANVSLFADNSDNKLELVMQSQVSNINVNHLFLQFNNFGQTTLTDRHIKGFATAEIDFSGVWNNELEVIDESIKTTANISIDKGELIDFKPLLSLSKFVDVKELQHIKFSNLQGRTEIKNGIIYLPKTSIKNSALNIDLSGTHTFNNEIDYHIQLLLSDLLTKKRKSNSDDFGLIENDPENRRSAFIRMTGTVDNPIIKFDRTGLKEKVKADIKQEKQTIKQLLKEEFGLFKKDSVRKTTMVKEQVFELEKPTNTQPKPLEPKKKMEEDEDF